MRVSFPTQLEASKDKGWDRTPWPCTEIVCFILSLYDPMCPVLDQVICHILDTQAGTVTLSRQSPWSRTLCMQPYAKFSVNTGVAHLAGCAAVLPQGEHQSTGYLEWLTLSDWPDLESPR